MSRFDLLAFDLGNVLTLVDEGRPIRRLASLSGQPEEEVFEAVFSPAAKAPLETGALSWEQFARTAPDSLGLNISRAEFRAVFTSALTPNAAVFDLVWRLATRYRLALCSNTSAPHWETERRRLPFAHVFDPVIVSYRVGALKPDRRIFDALARQSGVPHNRILFIDDTPRNVAGAREAGLTAIRFTGVEALGPQLAEAGVCVQT